MSEENVNEVLGIDESSPKVETESNSVAGNDTPNNAAENTLTAIATLVLWLGIIGTIFCLFTLTTIKVVDPSYTYSLHFETVFNPGGLAISVGVFISTLISWSLLKVVANISMTLKEINSKLK